jgi:hypothetical protein
MTAIWNETGVIAGVNMERQRGQRNLSQTIHRLQVCSTVATEYCPEDGSTFPLRGTWALSLGMGKLGRKVHNSPQCNEKVQNGGNTFSLPQHSNPQPPNPQHAFMPWRLIN